MKGMSLALTPFVEDRLWTCWRPQRFYGMQMGTRMTVCKLGDGSLWVHSPIAPDDALVERLRSLGTVRWLVAPSNIHHLYVLDFASRFPEAEIWGSPKLPAKRPDISFAGVLDDEAPDAWAGEFEQRAVLGNLYLDEVVFCHRPTRTLIVADLCEEANRDWPLVSRTLARLAGIYERHGPPRDMKLLFRHDKKATRQTVERILSWDFDRMILSHGRLVETGAYEVFRRAYEFALAW